MVLNANCVRDVLLYLEEHLSMTDKLETVPVSVFDLDKSDSLKYSIQELANTLIVLQEAGFLLINGDYGDTRITMLDVYRITYSGYEMIEKIRDEKRWKHVNKCLSAIRNYSLSAISSVAEGMTSAAINSYFSGQSNL